MIYLFTNPPEELKINKSGTSFRDTENKEGFLQKLKPEGTKKNKWAKQKS